MLVFRFEDDNLNGAYKHILYDNHTAQTGHPGPINDITPELRSELSSTGQDYFLDVIGYAKMKMGHSYDASNIILFGFSSLEQAYTWFDKNDIVEKQIPRGVHLHVYNVPEYFVVMLGHQVMFDITKAQRI